MPRPHDFRFESRGTNPARRAKSGDPESGEWHACPGCGKRVFFPDGWTDFQKRLTVASAWHDDVGVLGRQELDRRVVRAAGPFKMDKAFQGVLAEDCDAAREFVVESVLAS